MLSNMGESVILGVSWFNTLQFTNLDSQRQLYGQTDSKTPSILQPSTAKKSTSPAIKRITWKELERIRKSCKSIEMISIHQLFAVEIAKIREKGTTLDPSDPETHPLVALYPQVFKPKVPFPPSRPEFDMRSH